MAAGDPGGAHHRRRRRVPAGPGDLRLQARAPLYRQGLSRLAALLHPERAARGVRPGVDCRQRRVPPGLRRHQLLDLDQGEGRQDAQAPRGLLQARARRRQRHHAALHHGLQRLRPHAALQRDQQPQDPQRGQRVRGHHKKLPLHPHRPRHPHRTDCADRGARDQHGVRVPGADTGPVDHLPAPRRLLHPPQPLVPPRPQLPLPRRRGLGALPSPAPHSQANRVPRQAAVGSRHLDAELFGMFETCGGDGPCII
mmetsp:Transcript_8763/g.20684  ORF Transcript_8763/g.20684 Transcript_8763/m.20684 type:complete len:254 (+) Transcript_8763:2973-3734(+)